MANFCMQCGAPIEGTKFCTKCGAPVEEIGAAASSTSIEEADLTGFDTIDGEPASNYAAAAQTAVLPSAQVPQASSAPQAQYAQPAPQVQYAQAPAPKRGGGVKIVLVAAALLLGIGAGVALATLQPWNKGAAPIATSSAAASSSEVSSDSSVPASTDASSRGEDGSSSSAGDAPAVTEPATTSNAASSAPSADSQSSAASSKKEEVKVAVSSESSQEKKEESSAAATAEVKADYILADSATREYSRSELESLSSDDLSRAQNEIWARHGRKFKNNWLQDYFNSQSWYNGTINPDDFTSVYKSTSTEDKNASLISSILTERGWDVNREHPN